MAEQVLQVDLTLLRKESSFLNEGLPINSLQAILGNCDRTLGRLESSGRCLTTVARKRMSLRLGVVGCGVISSKYVVNWLKAYPDLSVEVVADVSDAARERFASEIQNATGKRPLTVGSTSEAITAGAKLNAMYIATPHSSHFAEVSVALQAKLDVLIEKPLAFDRDQIMELIRLRDKSGAILVVAYQGALSPLSDKAAAIIRSKELGELRSIQGLVWQNWKDRYADHWKQKVEISGGGFLIDTGVHLLNTLCHTMSGPPEKICAVSDEPRGRPEFVTSFLGTYPGNIPVSVLSCGDSYPTCEGWLEFIMKKGRLKLECWGRWMEITRCAEAPPERLTTDSILGPMAAFMQVRTGALPNPSPAERSLDVAALWQAVILSGQGDGSWVKIQR